MEDSLHSVLLALGAEPAPGAILVVRSAVAGVDFTGSTGQFSRLIERQLTVDDGFRIASMSKTFTGTIMMQLAEEGRIDLSQPLGDFLDVSNMPVSEGHSTDEVTLQRLLNHNAGFWDFALSREWGRAIRKAPGNFRDPKSNLEWAFKGSDPVGPPGEQYFYSDTGYVALGLVIETVTGLSWGDNCRHRIIAPLDLTSTWLEGYESPRSTLSHTYVGDYDALAIHGSTDWAAGGHVSTADDLVRFMQALVAGALFSSPDTLDRMKAGVPSDIGIYGAGVAVREVHGFEVIGHGGYWGSFMAAVPGLDLVIAGTANHTQSDRLGTVDAVIEALVKAS